MIKKKIAVVISFLPLLAFKVSSAAITVTDGGGGGVTLINPLSGAGISNFGDLISKVLSALFDIILVVAPIIIVIGAFQMMFAAGDPEKFKKGERTMVYAVIGLVVVLMAKGIVAIVKNIITGS